MLVGPDRNNVQFAMQFKGRCGKQCIIEEVLRSIQISERLFYSVIYSEGKHKSSGISLHIVTVFKFKFNSQFFCDEDKHNDRFNDFEFEI